MSRMRTLPLKKSSARPMQSSDSLSWVLSRICVLIKSLQPSVHPSEVCTHEKKLENCLTAFHKILPWEVLEKKNPSRFSFSSYGAILMIILDKDHKHFCSLKRLHPCSTPMRISHHTRLQRCCSDTEKVKNVSTSRLYGCTLSSVRFYVKTRSNV